MSLISKTVTFFDGTRLDILDATTIHPSGSSYIRSYMDLHMAENAMSIGAFEALMNDENKTKSMTIETVTEDGQGKQSTAVEIINNYIVVSECGKKLVETVDPFTGTVLRENHLVARLEQLTYIEQKLHDLGVL